MTTRRDFVKSGCLACLGGVAGISTLLEACSPKNLPLLKFAEDDEKILKVPTNRFVIEKTNLLILRTTKLENDILLIKENGQYRALYLQCTHEGLDLTPTSSKIYCAAHGSMFDFAGNVITEPALKPLKQFKTALINSEIIISIFN